jgi:exodeoxyribonuclease VII large subunit
VADQAARRSKDPAKDPAAAAAAGPANGDTKGPARGQNVAELTVTELSNGIKRTLEGTFGYVRLRGEISGYRGPHASGHCYFALKDEKAKIDAVIWRGVFGALRFKPEEGMEVIATGKVTSYPGSSKYQIVVDSLEPAGVGALMALLEERKRKLGAEGLFAPERKRPIPFLPRVIGIVTSPTGAVIRDMMHGFTERFPAHVIVWPVRVQGETCAAEVAAAVRGFNAFAEGGRLPRPDVLIVARGGGSLEDLWGFNEEIVVRAVAESSIPVISAVGHETDWTLIDLVADARAPTPTKAAEWAVPKHSELMERTYDFGYRLRQSWRRLIEENRTRLNASARGLPRLSDILALPRQRFDTAAARLPRALTSNTQAYANRMARISSRLRPQLLEQRIARSNERLQALSNRGVQALARTSHRQRTRLERVAGRLQPGGLLQRLSRNHERLDVLTRRAARAFHNAVALRRRQLESHEKVLAALSYQSVLERGFAIVRSADGAMLRSIAGVQAKQTLDIEIADGRFGAVTTGTGTGPGDTGPGDGTGTRQPAALNRTRPAPVRGRPRGRDRDQGSLF